MPPVRPGNKDNNDTSKQAVKKPDVRLAYWAHLDDRKAFEEVEPSQSDPPTVRLVGANDSGIAGARIIETATKNLGKDKNIEKDSPTIRLAHGPGAQGDNVLLGRNGVAPLPDYSLPGLLVSFFYLPQFLKNRHRYRYRDWVMDSGAFSAHNSGVTIDLKEYIETCKQLMAEDPSLVEIYSLDVIGDWKASLKNTEKMWAEGVPAIPCFHADEPWSALLTMARDYPKIALGGVALAKSGKKMAWANQCFARVWPKRIHGFAFCSEKAMMALPFESCDSTSWEVGACLGGDTLVNTSSGLEPIKDLVDKEHLCVRTVQGVLVEGCKAVYSGEKETISLKLQTGQTVRVTRDHKILTDGGWKLAGRLVIGDLIRIPDTIIVPPVIEECLLDEMFGWMTGDGWYTQITHNSRPRKGARVDYSTREAIGILFCADSDAEAARRLLPIWDWFVEREYSLTQQLKIVKKTCEDRRILDKFASYGFVRGTGPDKQLPRYILTASSQQQLAFLKGLFSADGCVVTKKRSKSVYIALASNSKQLLNEVQTILLNYGIQSYQNWAHPKEHKNEQGQLRIHGISAMRYMRLISFNLSAKREKYTLTDYMWKPKKYLPLISITTYGIESVYDIQMPTIHHFLANGVVVHNCKYGQWKAFGGQRVSVRGSKQNLRLEVQYYLDLEERLRQRWKKEMIKLDEACPRYCLRPEVRLALGATGSDSCHKEGEAVQRGLSGPTIRLAEGGEGGRIEAKSKALKGKE